MNRMQHAEQSLVDAPTSALLRIAAAIERAGTLEELLDFGLQEFSRLFDLRGSAVLMINDDGISIRLAQTLPPLPHLPPPFRLDETTILARVVADRTSLQIDDLSTTLADPNLSPVIQPLLPLVDAAQACAVLLLPLVRQDECFGVLCLAGAQLKRPFSALEMAQARLLAGQLSAALISFRITEQAERRSAELATLNDIAAAVTSSLNTREVYHLVMEKINKYFRVDAGSLLMLDEETDELVFVMTLEAGEEKLFGVRIPRGRGIVWSVAITQRYDIVNDVDHDPRFLRNVSDSVNYQVHNILCVPIVVKGRTIGVIELLNKHNGLFNEEEAVRLTRMAATIGVAIENARLFQTATTVRDRFEAILNSTNDGILMADMRDVVVTANPEAGRLLQVRPEELVGQPLSEVLKRLRARASAISQPSWLNSEESDQQVVELDLPDPQRCVVRHYLLPVCETSGAEIGRLALFQDISKERELAQLREDYTGMLVHDLRAPLTAIMNGIMMVKRGLGGPISEQQQELLAIAHQGSQAMLEMVNTLLDIAKLEQGRLQLDREPLSPYVLADAALDRLRVSAQNQEIRLLQALPVGLPPLEADREQLVRVLQNLLDNAIKFSPMGGSVTLGAYYAVAGLLDDLANDPMLSPPLLGSGDWLIFWIRDQGPGIPPQYHARVFEKFGQVRNGRKVRGTGLGLTFCKLAVEAHGGRIWLRSLEGVGSTFALALPLVGEPSSPDAG